jgi:hypothetical protein
MSQSPQGAGQTEIVSLLAAQIGVPIDPADFERVEAMVRALWRSGGQIRYAFGDDVSVIPLPAVPDHHPE